MSTKKHDNLRKELVRCALRWQKYYGVAPHITSALSEYDAAVLKNCLKEYLEQALPRTSVTPGYDFECNNKKYQVKANRPSGKPGSKVTLVANPKNYDWDFLIWILYDEKYKISEAWEWKCEAFKKKFENKKRLGPKDMQGGKQIYFRKVLSK